jgi:hypothetical protein
VSGPVQRLEAFSVTLPLQGDLAIREAHLREKLAAIRARYDAEIEPILDELLELEDKRPRRYRVTIPARRAIK